MAATIFPIGTVLFFYGAFTDNVTMVGWYKCNAANLAAGRTPDLEDKFVRGAAASGGSGGSDDAVNISHTHDTVNTDSHNHGGTTGNSSPATHSHGLYPWFNQAGGATGAGGSLINTTPTTGTFYVAAGNHDHAGTMVAAGTHGHTVNTEGAAGAGKNMPSYKKAIPIMRVS